MPPNEAEFSCKTKGGLPKTSLGTTAVDKHQGPLWWWPPPSHLIYTQTQRCSTTLTRCLVSPSLQGETFTTVFHWAVASLPTTKVHSLPLKHLTHSSIIQATLTAEHLSTAQLQMEQLNGFFVTSAPASRQQSSRHSHGSRLQVYGTTLHATTSFSPYELMYGRKILN